MSLLAIDNERFFILCNCSEIDSLVRTAFGKQTQYLVGSFKKSVQNL
jgi:hypothetical protein